MTRPCLILSSEFPPRVIGGVGRYVHEIAQRLGPRLPLSVMVVSTYDGAQGLPSAQPGGGLAVAFDDGGYRQALSTALDASRLHTLTQSAEFVAARCRGLLGSAAAPAVYVQDYALAPVAAALRAALPGARVVAACHLPVSAGFTYFDKPIGDAMHQVLEAKLVQLAHRVVVPSEFAARMLRLTHNVPRAKLAVVPLGAARPQPPTPLPPGPLRLLAVGRPTEQKGFHFLLQAQRALRSHIDVRLTLACGRADAQRVVDLVQRFGVVEAVRFAPARAPDEIWSLYDEHHLLVSTSLYETFGLAVLEAMASARPTVGFAVGALPALWGDELAPHFATPVADVNALVARILALHEDRVALARLGQRAAERARGFSWERHVDDLLGLLQPTTPVVLEPAWH